MRQNVFGSVILADIKKCMKTQKFNKKIPAIKSVKYYKIISCGGKEKRMKCFRMFWHTVCNNIDKD